MELLDRYVDMCLGDTRDVMLAAEYETAPDSQFVRRRDFSKSFAEAQLPTD